MGAPPAGPSLTWGASWASLSMISGSLCIFSSSSRVLSLSVSISPWGHSDRGNLKSRHVLSDKPEDLLLLHPHREVPQNNQELVRGS